MNRLASKIANVLAVVAVIWLPVRASMPRSCCCTKAVRVAPGAALGGSCCSHGSSCCGGGHETQHGLSSSPGPKPHNCPCNCPCKCSQNAGPIAIASVAVDSISRTACFVALLPSISLAANGEGQDFKAWHANPHFGSGFDRCIDLCRFRL